MSMLFSPIKLGPLELANRIAIAPMCQYPADEGLPTELASQMPAITWYWRAG